MQKDDPTKITSIIEEMKSPDSKLKVEAIRQLNVVAVAIGKERSKNELIPYINGKILIFNN